MENRRIAVTSPLGNWSYDQVIGASVHIKSSSVGSGLFGYDSEATYLVEKIMVRLDSLGNCASSIYLVGIERPFYWKDLEVVGLDLTLYPDAISGGFKSGDTLSGYQTD